jgi:hypothetical protein
MPIDDAKVPPRATSSSSTGTAPGRPPSQRTQPARRVGDAPAPSRPPATNAETAPDEPTSNSAPSQTGDAREASVSDEAPPDLFTELTRLNAAPIPDDPAQLEAQIREMDRIHAAIAEHLHARSSMADSETESQVSQCGDGKRRT